MKFSIIIPAYNIANYLDNCVQSVLNQSYENYELIIVNDGSTDNTGEIADKFLLKSNKVSVIHQTNGGASKARNNGIKNSTGDYILFLDGDDFWSDTDFLHQLAVEIEMKVSEVVIFGFSYYDNGRIKSFPVSDENDLVKAVNAGVFNGPNWNKCISKELIKNGLVFPEDLVSEDSLYCSQILKLISNFSVLSSTQYMYRQNRLGSLTNSIKEKNVLDTLKGISRGLDDYSSLSKEKQDAINIYFSISYISIIPYVERYLSNGEIYNLLRNYKYLLRYSKNINNKPFMLTGQFTRIFGINFSTKIFAYLLKFYK